MKHSIRITLILLCMFLVAQFIGLAVINSYNPHQTEVQNENGTLTNTTTYNLPYGMGPPEGVTPTSNIISIVIALIIAITVMFLLMKFGAQTFLRVWFFVVIILALAITINAPLSLFAKYSSFIALLIALPLAYLKVFKRNILVHNATELFIYPGIAAIFVPLLNIWTVVILLIIISLYDMWAVWHSGVMQKMAKYQIKTLRIFSGFFIPYLGKKERELVKNKSKSSKLKDKKIKVNLAILGGGDIVFPMILMGVVMRTLDWQHALLIPFGALFGLAYLFYRSEKGKFYPAMPFITVGCFIALVIAYFI